MTVRFWRLRGAPVLLFPLLLSSCGKSGLPAVDSTRYRDFVTAFYVGLAGLQTGEDVRAKERLTQATQLAPGEPAAWANLALFSVRQGDLDRAYDDAEKARKLAPDNSRIEELLGAIEAKRGKLPESIGHFQKAVQLDGDNLKALYSLAEQTERQGSDKDAEHQLEDILKKRPDNIAVEVEVARLAAKTGDAPGLRTAVEQLKKASTDWPAEGKDRLTALEQAIPGANSRAAAVQAAFLRNVLARVPDYRRTLDDVKTPVTFVGDPLIRFVKLPTPESRPAPSDAAISFTATNIPTAAATWAGAIPLDSSGKLWIGTVIGSSLSLQNGATLAFAGPGAPASNSVLAADLNYDFKNDLVLANASGVRIYQQQDPNHFEDVSSRTKLPDSVLHGNYTGAWAFDIDLDGDLDVVLGTPSGDSVVLRNNGDGTFAFTHPFQNISGLTAFAAADMDGDGDPDVATLDGQGHLHLLLNERLGQFRETTLPASAHGEYASVTAADLNGDTFADFVLWKRNGEIQRLSASNDTHGWALASIVNAAAPQPNAKLLVGDFDNNGAFDIVAGDRMFLNDGRGFSAVRLAAGMVVQDAGDLDSDGKLDLLALSPDGKLSKLINHGKKNYNWQTIRVRAANGHGDQRINSFGIGGEVEIRSNLLTQKQTIRSPDLHFGLGTHTLTDVARIVWPNGSVQAEFALKPDVSILAEQRLKGSCPSLFAWNGREMRFVKDSAPWSPALGLRINAQKIANVQQTEEWFKLPGDAVASRDGHYDLRVTDELWETFYIDHYALQAVDHPDETEIYTDERFAVPPPALKIYTVKTPQPFASVIDDRNNDVAAFVQANDGKYLDDFGRGRYQGVSRDHWVDLELPRDAPQTGKLYLIASGWLHPTDASINIALSQNSDAPPRGLSIEVPDRRGRWISARPNLGFLAGKLKTAVLDISGIFQPGAPRKLRLRTNMEIYWDQLAWAAGSGDERTTIHDLPMTRAHLVYRGFSAMRRTNASSPEIPDYSAHGAAPLWRDLEGYYTRYGDVRELLAKTDDRYIIQNAGDELRLEFSALPPPPKDWKRDFVMIGNGWVKDGDYNSGFSQTVLPLPYRAMSDYTHKPTSLEQDPAYLAHPSDWDYFHTRYVTPQPFNRALWNKAVSTN